MYKVNLLHKYTPPIMHTWTLLWSWLFLNAYKCTLKHTLALWHNKTQQIYFVFPRIHYYSSHMTHKKYPVLTYDIFICSTIIWCTSRTYIVDWSCLVFIRVYIMWVIIQPDTLMGKKKGILYTQIWYTEKIMEQTRKQLKVNDWI